MLCRLVNSLHASKLCTNFYVDAEDVPAVVCCYLRVFNKQARVTNTRHSGSAGNCPSCGVPPLGIAAAVNGAEGVHLYRSVIHGGGEGDIHATAYRRTGERGYILNCAS